MENSKESSKVSSKVFYREVTLDHPFFKTQKHFVNFCNKLIRDRELVHEFYTNRNISLMAWCLSNIKIFNRNGIEIPIDRFTWELRNNSKEDLPISDLLLGAVDEIVELKNRVKSIRQCEKLLESFPCLSEDKIIDTLYNKLNFSDTFLELLNKCYQKSGVYFLYDLNDELIYVGRSYNLYNRIQSSIVERKAFSCKVLITHTESDCNILEMYYINLLKPILNSSSTTLDSPSFTINYNESLSELIKIYK